MAIVHRLSRVLRAAAAMGWSVLISIAVANSRSSVPDRVTSQDLNTNAAAEAALSLTGGRVVPFSESEALLSRCLSWWASFVPLVAALQVVKVIAAHH